MRKLLFAALGFVFITTVGFTPVETGGFASIENEPLKVENNQLEKIITTYEDVYTYDSSLSLFTCRVLTTIKLVDREGNSTTIFNDYLDYPDGDPACGGTVIRVIRTTATLDPGNN
jgi:hypothetical protein